MKVVYSRSKLVDYIVDYLESGKSESDLAKEVATYLIEVNKVNELDSIMRDAQEMRAQKYGTVELSARVAHRLDETNLNEIKSVAKNQYPNTKKVLTHQIQDKSVIGGVSLSFPHANLDLTVRAKLNQLKGSIS